MTQAIDAEAFASTTWRRIAAWIRSSPDAVLCDPAFNPPARPEDVAVVEKRIGLAFPPELSALYLEHDGASIRWLPEGMWLRTLNEIESDWNHFAQLCDEFADDEIDNELSFDGTHFTNVYHRSRLPLATREDGPELFLDFRPGPQGTAGQVLYLVTECTYVIVGQSFADFADCHLTLLETGQLALRQGGIYPADGGDARAMIALLHAKPIV